MNPIRNKLPFILFCLFVTLFILVMFSSQVQSAAAGLSDYPPPIWFFDPYPIFLSIIFS